MPKFCKKQRKLILLILFKSIHDFKKFTEFIFTFFCTVGASLRRSHMHRLSRRSRDVKNAPKMRDERAAGAGDRLYIK